MRLSVFVACAVVLFANHLALAARKQHPVKPDELVALIQRADKIIVYGLQKEDRRILYSSSSAADIAALKAATTIQRSEGWFRCACMPSLEIDLSLRERQLGTLLVYPDALTIGFGPWSGDARIDDKERWLQWFDVRKIPGPRLAVKEDQDREKRDRENEERWLSAMPRNLRPLWAKAMEQMMPGKVNTEPLDLELAKQFPESQKRILALISWHGSGAGPWSGFPMYEAVPEEMLLKYSTSELLAAIQSVELNDQEMEGAARLFGGWDFNQRRPHENSLIPAGLREGFLDHCLSSTDEDKLARARRAFGE